MDSLSEVPASGIRYVLINEAVVKGECKALYWSRGDATLFWSAWAKEEQREAILRVPEESDKA